VGRGKRGGGGKGRGGRQSALELLIFSHIVDDQRDQSRRKGRIAGVTKEPHRSNKLLLVAINFDERKGGGTKKDDRRWGFCCIALPVGERGEGVKNSTREKIRDRKRRTLPSLSFFRLEGKGRGKKEGRMKRGCARGWGEGASLGL